MFEFIHSEPIENEKLTEALSKFEAENNITVPYLIAYIYTHYEELAMGVEKFAHPTGYKMEVNKIFPLIGEGMTVSKIYAEERKDGFISDTLIPFAMDRGGNIYYWKSDYVDGNVFSKCPIVYITSDDCENEFTVADDVLDFLCMFGKTKPTEHEATQIYEWLQSCYKDADDQSFENARKRLLQVAEN